MQLCGKHISTAVSQHATIEIAMFSDGPSRGSITRISRLELELSQVPELAIAAEN
jgi:hypothetical protein